MLPNGASERLPVRGTQGGDWPPPIRCVSVAIEVNVAMEEVR